MELKNNASSRPSLIYSWLVVFYSDSNGQVAKSQTAASAKSCLGPHSQPSCKLGRVGLFLTIFNNKPKTYDLKLFFNPKTFPHPKFFSQKKYIGLKTFLWPNKSFKNSLTTNNFVQLALDWAWHSSVPTYFPLSCHVTRFISLPISYNQIYIRLPCSHGDRLQ